MEAVTDPPATSAYDEVPYPSLSYGQSHPDRLATVATLLGMHPPPVDRCRVLELGCASGGNLIPMAYGLPESQFVGVDNSHRQIEQGRANIAALGLQNITLEPRDILDVDTALGTFDYIIAHGVFSWVPRPVQDKVLEICRQLLAPHGVAYVSYNTYPGWHMVGSIRDMMLYHTRSLTDPRERATQARALLDFLVEAVPAEGSAYGSFLDKYSQILKGELDGGGWKSDDAFLLHDELEEVNEPIYFYQFAERAAACGLQYLGEAQFRTMLDSNFPAHVSAQLRRMANSVVDLEQRMDFLRNRTFRETLLCHQEVSFDRRLGLERLEDLYVASCARPVTQKADVSAVTVEQFRASDGAALSTDHPVTKAAMRFLVEVWPRGVPFGELLATARWRLGLDTVPGEASAARDAQVLGTNLLTAYGYSDKLVELHAYVPSIVTELSECPEVSPLARFQSQRGSTVTNLRHERVNLDRFDRTLLPWLNGSRDRGELVELLASGPVAEGLLVVREEAGGMVQDHEKVRRILAEELEAKLRWLARAALLVG